MIRWPNDYEQRGLEDLVRDIPSFQNWRGSEEGREAMAALRAAWLLGYRAAIEDQGR